MTERTAGSIHRKSTVTSRYDYYELCTPGEYVFGHGKPSSLILALVVDNIQLYSVIVRLWTRASCLCMHFTHIHTRSTLHTPTFDHAKLAILAAALS